jgi:hypothetical protein
LDDWKGRRVELLAVVVVFEIREEDEIREVLPHLILGYLHVECRILIGDDVQRDLEGAEVDENGAAGEAPHYPLNHVQAVRF